MRKVTMKDVAKEAGVSVATVSYVLNDTKKYKISEETKEKVLQVIQDLGFVPNSAAKTLKMQEVNCIGLVMLKQFSRNLSDRYFKRLMTSVKNQLNEYNYQMMMCSGEKDSLGFPDYVSYFLEKRIGGIIYIVDACQKLPYEELQAIQKYNIPAVIVDSECTYENVCNLQLNYYTSTIDFLRYIVQKQKIERIMCLCPDEAYQPEKTWEQSNAVGDFSKEFGIPLLNCRISHIDECDHMDQTVFNVGFKRWLSVYKQVENYVEKVRESDLLFCTNGFLGDCALALIKNSCKKIVLAIGEEFQTIPVQWFDYINKGGYIYINNMQPHKIGVKAAEMIHERLKTGENHNIVQTAFIVDFTKQLGLVDEKTEEK